MKAFLNGIPFHVLDPSESAEWEVKVTEFVTKHPPVIRRLNRGPSRFCVSALLVGKMASLLKDLMIKTLSSETPAKLIHPLFGIRQVICAKYHTHGFSNSANAYVLEMEFVEKEDASSLLGSLTKAVTDATDAVQSLALAFYQQMEIVRELGYNVEKMASLVSQVKGFLTSPSGVGAVAGSMGEISDTIITTVALLKDPKKLLEEMRVAAFSLSQRDIELAAASISRIPKQGHASFMADTALILLIAAARESLQQHTEALMAKAGSGIVTDEVFAYLWEKSLTVTKKIEIKRKRAFPSLVASYLEHSSIEHAEEMAREAGQPFAV